MCSCCDGLIEGSVRLRALFSKTKNHHSEREKFERIVAFLGEVPLFKSQLPQAELPKVAKHLVMKTWKPGAIVVKQGDLGECFWLILSGEGKAITADDETGVSSERCRLTTGDYWGGQSLINQIRNVADIQASGKEELVTLSMSRTHFEQLGFMTKLVWTKRPKLHRNPTTAATIEGHSEVQKPKGTRTKDEQQFILASINRSPNLRALLSELDWDETDTMAAGAERREVKKDTIVAQCGEFGEAFFIIASGCVSVMVDTNKNGRSPLSAEVAVASSKMAERVKRKQDFMQDLHKSPSSRSPRSPRGNRRNSRSELMFDCRSPRHRERHSLSQSLEKYKLERNESLRKCEKLTIIDRDIKIGDHVAFAGGGGEQDSVGIVQEILTSGLAAVICGGQEQLLDMDLLHPILEPDVIARLEVGDSFGELSLLYNVRSEATFRAREDCVIYVIHGKEFRDTFKRRISREEEYGSLLDEVRILSPLFRAERIELARQACGFVECKPFERVLIQDEPREEKLWYVIHRGYGLIYTNEDRAQKVRLERAAHFGERSLLRGAESADVNVDAGPQGMVCLTFNGELIRRWLLNIWTNEDLIKPEANMSVKDWLAWKGKNGAVSDDVQLDDLMKVDLLGCGGFADVYLAWDPKNDTHYALKRMSKGYVQSLGQEVVNVVVWERDLMFKVDSPFIVKLYTTFKDSEYIYFCFEAVLGGNLLLMLHKHSYVFTEDEPRGANAAFYAACLIAGLEHLHERCIVYRDMKLENVLIDETGYAKICDMGFARYVLDKTNTMCGTPEYMPPEQIDFPHWHSHSADWWSLGVLIYELLVGQPPFDDEGIWDKRERLLAIRRSQEQGRIVWPFSCPRFACQFIERLLKKLPSRLGADGGAPVVRQDEWFKRLNFDFDALHRQALQAPFLPGRSEKLDLQDEVDDSIRTSIFVPYRKPRPGDPDSSWTQYF